MSDQPLTSYENLGKLYGLSMPRLSHLWHVIIDGAYEIVLWGLYKMCEKYLAHVPGNNNTKTTVIMDKMSSS